MQDDNMYFDQRDLLLLLRIHILLLHILLLPHKNLFCLHYLYDNNNNDIFIKIFENFFKNIEYTGLVEKIQFQLIFIKSEYLTIRIKDLNDKIKYLEQLIISYNINLKEIKDENERLKNENNNLKYSIANQKIEYEEKISNLKNEYDIKIGNLKSEYDSKIKKLESLLNTQ